jgi:hypothetical protein
MLFSPTTISALVDFDERVIANSLVDLQHLAA